MRVRLAPLCLCLSRCGAERRQSEYHFRYHCSHLGVCTVERPMAHRSRILPIIQAAPSCTIPAMTLSITRSIGAAFGMRGMRGTTRLVLWGAGLWFALLVGALLHMVASRNAEEEARRRFEYSARAAQEHLATAITSYSEVTRALVALFSSSPTPVTRLQFHRYVALLDLRANYPAIDAVSYSQEVPDSAREAFVAAVRADRSLDPLGYPGFDISPPGRRPSYNVLTYIEPPEKLAEKFGVDITANAPVAAAMAQARDTGTISASGSPIMVSTPVPHMALGMRAPVYRGAALPQDVESRRAAYVGAVGIAFSVPELVERALAKQQGPALSLSLFAAARGAPPAPPPPRRRGGL
ncbi:MAG TPA: hypothetical protein DCX52_17385, partial [Massilia sp.]|nr:hypothetical protein [Massilia sp.]